MSSQIDQYALPAVLTLAGCNQLVRFAKAVGAQRHKHSVKVPETTGPPEFIRTYRAHQNSLEFYPMSLSGLWMGSVFCHPVPASLLYAGYLVGRERFFHGYVEDAEKRLPGFHMSIRFLLGLFFLSAAGVGHKLVRYYGDIDLWEIILEKCPIGK